MLAVFAGLALTLAVSAAPASDLASRATVCGTLLFFSGFSVTISADVLWAVGLGGGRNILSIARSVGRV